MNKLDEWKKKGLATLSDFFQRLPTGGRKALVYGATAAVLLPLLQLGQETATLTFWQFLINTGAAVGQNLVASWIEHFSDAGGDERKLAELIEQQAEENEKLLDAVSALLEYFDVSGVVEELVLSERDKAWIVGALRGEMQVFPYYFADLRAQMDRIADRLDQLVEHTASSLSDSVAFRQQLRAYLNNLLSDEIFAQWNEENYLRLRGRVAGSEQKGDILALINELFPSGRLIILEGSPGTGKTTALQRLMLERAREVLRQDLDSESLPCVPVLIDLESYAGQNELTPHFDSFLRNHGLRLNTVQLTELLATGEMDVLIDSFDTVCSADWSRGMAALRSYLTQYEHHTKVVACRPHMVDQLVAQLGSVEYVKLQLQPLAKDQLWNYLQQKPSLPIELREQVRTNAGLMSLLCQNRLVCSYLVEALNAGSEIGQLPASLGALLGHIVRHVVDRDRRALLREHKHLPSVAGLCRVLSYLGWNVCNEGTTSCDEEDVITWIDEIKSKARVRRYSATQIVDWLETTSWLRQENGRFHFRHPYVIDILAAMELKERFGEVGASAAWGLGPSSDPGRWQEVVVLLAGMLQQEQAVSLVEMLLRIDQVRLAGRCTAEGQPLPHFIEAHVIQALLDQLAEAEQR
jgi:hypothetical protein